MKSADTSKEIEDAQIAWYRKLSSSQRCFYTAQMMDEGRLMIESRIKSRNPGISTIDLQIETFKRMYKEDFTKEQLEEITISMRKSLQEYETQNQKL